MSASTRTVQRSLGINQLGSMLVLLAVIAAVIAAITFASFGSQKTQVAPAAAGFPPPVVRDLGSRDAGVASDSGLSYWQPDRRGGIELVPVKPATGSGTSGFGGFGGPRLGADEPATGQPNGTSPNRMHAQ
jgi:hypothetical protein